MDADGERDVTTEDTEPRRRERFGRTIGREICSSNYIVNFVVNYIDLSRLRCRDDWGRE